MIEMSIGKLIIMMGVPTAVTGFCVWLLQRKISRQDTATQKREKERDARVEKREKAREQNEILLIKSGWASIALSEATATALKNGKCNGETTKALEYAKQVKHEQKDFLAKLGIEALH